ncbi:uncharacterized protein F5891DRAFT_979914 [Suillus fuscotomentosus]|uniref:Uncharacterized protein n=1 Tax=Suillus fuscotomentosus TaxID=1912939 RepID=A0AAD4HLY0_9AGAM|nr:uncharacterized protein F5891DRAFT_979914 [Suillus fuscotomentosus]KAG1901031.1 hypothetical protein F5891DRAFT_979914 [Suillus fuscotomentosus]
MKAAGWRRALGAIMVDTNFPLCNGLAGGVSPFNEFKTRDCGGYIADTPYDPYNSGFQREEANSDFGEFTENTAGSTATTRADRLISKEMQGHPLQQARETNIWYPFDGLGEWSLAKFLVKNLSQTQIDKFLKLDWFQTRERPQFKSKDELFFYMQQLPGRGPKWQCTKLKLKGYESEQAIHLIWRDALKVTKQLFANPVYAKHMCYDPHYIYQGQEHQFGEFWTSGDAWKIQDQLPEGATIVPIVLASDKTPVTRHTGGLEMHPLFLTIGNIQANVRMKATSHVWRCTAFMPTPTFVVNSDFQTLLHARLWHKCMDLVCSNLKVAAHVGEYMVDPSARMCYCFTPLINHVADLPKQLMITCVMKNSSPVTTATHKEFGDETPHPPRNGSDTYTLIQQLCNCVDPWNLIVFVREAKKLHLSGVHLPYWRNWRHSNPARFLTPEILHALHKFFFDHVLKWIKQIMGHELDVWFKSHHKRTGICHFSGGVSHVNQMTGREHRDIQCMIVPTLWGVASPGFIRAGKGGAKDDFFIPKLELMQSFTCAIFHVGSLMQWTADVSERLLITHCKHPFECTSRQQDFVSQIAHILDREEAIRLFDLYMLLSSSSSMPGQDPLINAIIMEDEEIASTETDPTLAWVSNANPAAQLRLQAPHPVRNHFLKGILSDNACIAFNVTVKADCSRLKSCRVSKFMPSHLPLIFLEGTATPCYLTRRAMVVMMGLMLLKYEPYSNQPSPEVPSDRVIRYITHAVEIIPVYQGPLGKDVNSGNSLEVFDDYFLNNFADKELYHSLSVISDN